jgi:hypothetical protein
MAALIAVHDDGISAHPAVLCAADIDTQLLCCTPMAWPGGHSKPAIHGKKGFIVKGLTQLKMSEHGASSGRIWPYHCLG